jgi:hypothetical protein
VARRPCMTYRVTTIDGVLSRFCRSAERALAAS